MSHLNNESAAQIASVSAEADVKTVATVASTKDAGRVKVGGMAIRFKSAPASTKDAGRVQIGGMAIRF